MSTRRFRAANSSPPAFKNGLNVTRLTLCAREADSPFEPPSESCRSVGRYRNIVMGGSGESGLPFPAVFEPEIDVNRCKLGTVTFVDMYFVHFTFKLSLFRSQNSFQGGIENRKSKFSMIWPNVGVVVPSSPRGPLGGSSQGSSAGSLCQI